MHRFPLPSRRDPSRAFSLVELLVVIFIIGVLLSILVPVVNKVRRSAQSAATQALIAKLQGAIEKYYQDYGAYPGPLLDIGSTGGVYVGGRYSDLPRIATAPAGYDLPSGATQAVPTQAQATDETTTYAPYQSITGTHNLVLGLLGGLYYDASATLPAQRVKYDPSLVGKGPTSLNPADIRTSAPYLDGDTSLSWRVGPAGKTGAFLFQDSISANDCPIPSFIDSYSEPMPLLYLRARSGTVAGKVSSASTTDPATLVAGYGDPNRAYNLAHVLGYTSSSIGDPKIGPKDRSQTTVGHHGLRHVDDDQIRTFNKGTTFVYPYDLNLFVSTPGQTGVPRAKDSYILISAGPDRIYGTNDDITSFGSVVP